MSPCAKRTRVFRRTGGECPKRQGEGGQGRPAAEGTGLHEAQAKEDREEAGAGRVAPILDGPGSPLKPVKRGAFFQSPQVSAWGRKADAPGGGKGALLVAASDRSERGAWEHPVAAGEVPCGIQALEARWPGSPASGDSLLSKNPNWVLLIVCRARMSTQSCPSKVVKTERP